MNESFFLTIGIPTYNRSQYLKELLPSLIEEIKDFKEIEILISDNNSTDDTSVYIESLKNTSILSYYKNDINVGGDANFIKVVEKSKGEYVWIFGDDDLLEENALNKIISCLKTIKPSLLILNEKNYKIKINSDKLFNTYQEFLFLFSIINKHYPLAHTLITSNIFKKEVFDINVAYKLLSSNYGHMYAIMSNLKNKSVYVLVNPTIIIRQVRAPFADKIDNLLLKQAKYLYFLGKEYQINRFKMYAFKFYISKLFFNITYMSLQKLHLLEIVKLILNKKIR